MKKSLLEIYALAVCFFSLAVFLILFGVTLWNVVSITSPEFTLKARVWERHQTDDAFRRHLVSRAEKDQSQPLEGTALTEERKLSFERALRGERREAAQDMAQHIIVLLITLIAFVIHWRIAARVRRAAANNGL